MCMVQEEGSTRDLRGYVHECMSSIAMLPGHVAFEDLLDMYMHAPLVL